MKVRFGSTDAKLEAGEWVSDNEDLARLLNTMDQVREPCFGYDPDPELTMAQHVIKLMGFGEIIEHEPPGAEPGVVY